MVRLSFILPVYNVAKFLPDCLNSLYAQDIPEYDYEIICVNDGSKDNSSEVIRNYQKNHPTLKLIEQTNAGVSHARNIGFEASQGKYIWFVDPDDMICANSIGTILRLLDDEKADIFELEYTTCIEDTHFGGQHVEITIDGYNKPASSGSGCLSVCLSEYLRKNKIFWNEQLAYGEDYLWAFQTKYRHHKSIFTHAQIYIYRQRASSAMHSSGDRVRNERHFSDMILLNNLYLNEYKRCENEEMSEEILDNIIKRRQLCSEGALTCLLKMCLSYQTVNEKIKHMKERGAYPYPYMFWNLAGRGTVNPLRNRLFSFLFPFQPYYLLVCCLYRLFSRWKS